MYQSGHRPSPSSVGRDGFTLAELLVATTLLAVVMAAVYTAFHSTVRTWRRGEENVDTYQSARQIMWLLSRDLHSIAPGSEGHFRGARGELTFFTVGQPMDVEEGEAGRVMKVRYRTRRSGLVREENILKGPLHPIERDKETVRSPKLNLGRMKRFDLSPLVRNFRIEYVWSPMPPQPRDPRTPPAMPVNPIVVQRHKLAWGLPHGIRIHLTFDDPSAQSGETTFSTQFAFRNDRTPIPRELAPKRGEGRS